MNNDNQEKFDLDGLKSLWQETLEGHVSNEKFISNHQILTIMQEKTSVAVQKVRRNLLIEILITIPLIIGFYISAPKVNLQIPNWAWVALIIATFSYHLYLFWKLQNQAAPTKSVLETIKQQLTELRSFIKMYKSMAIFGGITFFVANGVVAFPVLKNFGFDISISIVLLLLCASAGFGFFAGTRWYIDKLYGQYYATLEDSCKLLEQG